MGASIRMRAAIGIAVMLTACVPGPRLEATWSLASKSTVPEIYLRVDPAPFVPAFPSPPESAPARATTSGHAQAPAPAAAAEPAWAIHVTIHNLGEAVELDKVVLTADGQELERTDGGAGNHYTLRHGEEMTLSMTGAATDPSRMCLIPSELTVTTALPGRTTRKVKVRGALPTSLPAEWMRQCRGVAHQIR